MIDRQRLHEKEVVTFRANTPRLRAELLPMFRSLGFTLFDGVLSLERDRESPTWQYSAIADVRVELCGDEVYGFGKGKWDAVHLDYLFASVPFEMAATYVDVVFQVGALLGLAPLFRGRVIDRTTLILEFERFREDIRAEVAEEPGSEYLQQLIQTFVLRK